MKKQGISLIVLVITIIIMIILASTVIMTLSDTGIISAANDTINKSNKIEVTQYANLVWVEEYMSGKRGATLRDAVLERLDEYKDKYNIGVTSKGVTVKDKNESLDEDEDMSEEELLGPDNGGLYDDNGVLVASWDTLVNTYGLDAEKDYDTTDSVGNEEGCLKYIIDTNSALSDATHLVISNRITRVGDGALAGTSLKKITVPSNVKILGDLSLSGLELEEIVFSEGLEVIGNGALALSINITSITIPSTVTAIGDSAFAGTKITSLNIPAATTYLGESIAWGTNQMTSLTVEDGNPNYMSIDNVIFTKDGTVLSEAMMTKTGSYRVPDGVVKIRSGAMAGMHISSLTIPAGVEIIEDNAFEEIDCTEIIFEEGSKLKSIGKSSFIYTLDLIEISIPEGVARIEKSTFASSYVTKIELPSTITSIGDAAFSPCEKLTTLKINATTPPTIEGTIFSDNYIPSQIEVPTGAGATYKAAEGWSTYADKIVESGE